MKQLILTLLITAGFASSMFAQDFVYRAKNPAFGGETFNYNWLLSAAQVQDLTENPDQVERGQSNTLDNFAENLNRQLLNQLSRQLVTGQFGEQGLDEGVYTFGDFQIDVASGIDGLVITVFDASIGEQTQVIIPYF